MTTEEARALWVKALRSGEYKQTTGELRNGDEFCCLGVACDLYSKEYGDGWSESGYFLGEYGNLPYEVRHWLGVVDSNPSLKHSDGLGATTLIGLNDDCGFSFKQIADEIENDNIVLA